MGKSLKKAISFWLCLAVGFGLAAFYPSVVSETTVAGAASSANYYSGITATGGTQLLGQVHDLIVETHTHYSTYTDCKTPSIIKKTDPGSDSSHVMEFYSQADISASWGSGAVGTWNREHVWCQSHSNGLWGESGGGGDLHHIRPAESRVNSTRNNNQYGTVSNRDSHKIYYKNAGGSVVADAGYNAGGTFEPLDKVKGDVARIVMYVYTHYNKGANVGGTLNSNTSGTLHFTDIMAPSSESAAIELLLEWNESDPVDAIERTRNEAVYEIQGNRNPFIDHPEYADAIWGDGHYDPPVSDIKPTSLTITPSAVTMSVGGTQNLTVTPTPSNASGEVKWSVEPKNIVTVADGKLTAYAEGQATVTATSTLDPNVKATASVTVKKPEGGGDGGSTTAGSFTITRSSFSAKSGGYGFYEWSAGGVKGIAFIYASETGKMQFNSDKDSCYVASTTAAPGPITKVTVKMQTGSKSWKLLTSSSAYGEVEGKPTNGNDHGTETVTTGGTSWNVSGTDTFFALTYQDTKAAYIDSITVEYGPSQGEDPTPPPPVHEHVFEYEDYTEETHLVGCKTCTDYLEEEPHVYTDDADTTCNLCGHVRTVHTHEYQYEQLDETYHTVTCKGCNEVHDKEVHEYSDSADTTCDKCGYERTIGGDEHTHSYLYTDRDDDTHTVTCETCGDVNETEPHEYSGDTDTTCNKCGHVRTVADEEKLAAFREAVAAISSEGTLAAWRESINEAIVAYNALSETEKTIVESETETLLQEIAAYDRTVQAYNEAAQKANGTAWKGAGSFLNG